MKVVLLKDVLNFGKKNDIREVKDGYGRNFLIKNKLAEILTPPVEKKIKSEKEKHEKIAIKLNEQAELLKKNVKNLNLILKIRSGESGQTFGSITPLKIADELKKYGINLNKEQILTKPIKIPGEYRIKIRLHNNLEAELSISIEKEKTK